jgi:hypothetical protein
MGNLTGAPLKSKLDKNERRTPKQLLRNPNKNLMKFYSKVFLKKELLK